MPLNPWVVPEPGGTADLLTDPSVQLVNFLKTNWPAGGANTTGTADAELMPYNPPTTLGNIKFDTKFKNVMNAKHAIVVQNLVQNIRPAVLGMSRVSHEDIKRIQVWATGTSFSDAVNKRWEMEQQIESLINANPLSIPATRGALITNFTQISAGDDSEISKGVVNAASIARSYALCYLYYDKAR